ncbi:MAG: hypothetical protein A2945_01080 [Candidatus Liptonbacteria bacterium RIFCSPLOWO2_01_FULL_52_25]|uniref:Uncharacterized protein n=1 Tax=Candidatus Liptonbacteria bacterium RIFCSPLOWO2_01_FULL_52_25 TaxID=1798650 RepID=A0A1G2CDF2_9BACT|nr:MAG: hypothetical protein A2945_01080 [Candidatus Liptonbacteria bacterium RIFCSPLOWO2_01_FULL_52_25]
MGRNRNKKSHIILTVPDFLRGFWFVVLVPILIGTGISLYTHSWRFILYGLLVDLLICIVGTIIAVKNTDMSFL